MGFKIKKNANSGFVRGHRPIIHRVADSIRSQVRNGIFRPVLWSKWRTK